MNLRLAVIGAALVAAGTTQATPITLKMTGFALGSANVDTSMTDVVGAGELKAVMTVDGVSNSGFLTYCTDLFQSFRWNTAYADYALAANGSDHGFSATQADRLAKLYTRVGAVHDRDESVAFQLAVWEIVDETAPKLDVHTGVFTIDSGASAAQLDLANSWLTAISAPDAAWDWTAQRLYSPTAQDFVIFAARPLAQDSRPDDAQPLPEPASLPLAGFALAGAAIIGRRRRR